MSGYIGIDNIAHNITNGYIGVNNVAKKINSIYMGDSNNKAQLVWEANNGINYLIVRYANSNENYTDNHPLITALDRTDRTTLNLRTTTNSITNGGYNNNVSVARNKGSVVSLCSSVTLNIYKQETSGYANTMSLNSSDLLSYIPNSGVTAEIHSAVNYSFTTGMSGLSANGQYVYVNVNSTNIYTTSQSTYSYSRRNNTVIIFDISSGNFVYKNALTINSYTHIISTTGTYTITLKSIDADDNLTVFSYIIQTISNVNTTVTTSYAGYACIGNINSGYCSKIYLPVTISGYYILSSTKIKVSRNGKYIAYSTLVNSNLVYKNKTIFVTKINHDNNTLSVIGNTLIYTANLIYLDFTFKSNYLYFLYTTDCYAESGTLYLAGYDITDTLITQKSNFQLHRGYNETNTYYSYNSNLKCPVNSLALDVDNNILFVLELGSSYIYKCDLTGSDGEYTNNNWIGYIDTGYYGNGSTMLLG